MDLNLKASAALRQPIIAVAEAQLAQCRRKPGGSLPKRTRPASRICACVILTVERVRQPVRDPHARRIGNHNRRVDAHSGIGGGLSPNPTQHIARKLETIECNKVQRSTGPLKSRNAAGLVLPTEVNPEEAQTPYSSPSRDRKEAQRAPRPVLREFLRSAVSSRSLPVAAQR